MQEKEEEEEEGGEEELEEEDEEEEGGQEDEEETHEEEEDSVVLPSHSFLPRDQYGLLSPLNYLPSSELVKLVVLPEPIDKVETEILWEDPQPLYYGDIVPLSCLDAKVVYADQPGLGPGQARERELVFVPGTLRYYLPDPCYRPPPSIGIGGRTIAMGGDGRGDRGRGGGGGYDEGEGDDEEKNNLTQHTSDATVGDYNNTTNNNNNNNNNNTTITTTITTTGHGQQRQRYHLIQTCTVNDEGDLNFQH